MNSYKEKQVPGLLHPFEPVFDSHSKVMVLGSFPSVLSRETAFYYGHPRNRFWPLLAALFNTSLPVTIAEKTTFLHRRHIAVWDVVASCTIQGSADSSLKPQQLNDIASLLGKTDIRTVFANGKLAGRLYQKHLEMEMGLPVTILPSTSPANAAWTHDRLLIAWASLKEAAQSAR